MTTSNLMSYPTDIVWKRLAFDEEMTWLNPPGIVYPRRWSPSLAIFYAIPSEDLLPEEYKNNIITYIKVVCSVTGTTLLPKEMANFKPWPPSHPACSIFANRISPYYGCYGAVLEVDVTPYNADINTKIDDYPWFIDFQPKKREIYESVSRTGEYLSNSKGRIAVKNSFTSVDETEVAHGSATAQIPNYRDLSHSEESSIRSIDDSRENREKYSQTTQLSQLYNELSSYHLGTNRALFYLQPKPHFTDSIVHGDANYQSFIWGPRRLEGVQEFFLIAVQPKSQPGICVNATLETGHFAFNKIPGQAIQPKPVGITQTYYHQDPLVADPTFQKPFDELSNYVARFGVEIRDTQIIDETINSKDPISWSDIRYTNNNVLKGPGWELTIDKTISRNLARISLLTVTVDSVGVKVTSVFEGPNNWPILYATILIHLLDSSSQLDIPEDKESIEFFSKRKRVGACLDENDNIVPAREIVTWQAKEIKGGQWSGSSDTLNNRIGEAMKDQDELILEMHGPGPVSNPLHSEFAIHQFMESLPDISDEEWLGTSILELTEMPDRFKQYFYDKDIRTRIDFLNIPLQELQLTLRLSNEEARTLYLNGWDIPS